MLLRFHLLSLFSGNNKLSQVLWLLSRDLWALEKFLPDLSDHFGIQGKTFYSFLQLFLYLAIYENVFRMCFFSGTGRVRGWLTSLLWREWTRSWWLYVFSFGSRQASLQVRVAFQFVYAQVTIPLPNLIMNIMLLDRNVTTHFFTFLFNAIFTKKIQ